MRHKKKLIVIGTLALLGLFSYITTPRHEPARVVAAVMPSPIPLIPQSEQYSENKDLARRTVAITNQEETSGGTGVIVESTPSRSFILTNNHVCEIFQVGGKVITDDGKSHAVAEYRQSLIHDLCLVLVPGNLHVNTKIALNPPADYEPAIVSGHPSLYPTIITRGHFSKKKIIDVMVGTKPCTKTDMDGPDALLCVFAGGIPVIKSFLSQVISATIKPGSSGSAVYNDRGELSGLVFAGEQGLAYGFIVPYDFIRYFLFTELSTLQSKQPLYTHMATLKGKSLGTSCKDVKNKVLRDYCDLLERNLIVLE